MVLETDTLPLDNLAFVYLYIFPSSHEISHTLMISASTTQQRCLGLTIRAKA